jgi:serine/threonine protein kinase
MAYKFTEIQIKSIYKQLLDVLDFMHTRNYVHRDLKVRCKSPVPPFSLCCYM